MPLADQSIELGPNGTVVRVGPPVDFVALSSSSNTSQNGLSVHDLVSDKKSIIGKPIGPQLVKAEETEEGHVGWKPSESPFDANIGVCLAQIVSLSSDSAVWQHVEVSDPVLDRLPWFSVPCEYRAQRPDLAAWLLGKPIFQGTSVQGFCGSVSVSERSYRTPQY